MNTTLTRINRIAATAALVVWTITLLVDTAAERTAFRAGGRDRGEVLEKVIVVAGFAAMALLVVAWIRPVVMRYLYQIH